MFSKYRTKDIILHTETNEVETEGQKVKLTPKEMGVLAHLMEKSGITVSRTELLEKVWGYKFANDQGLTQAISKLRRILAKNPNASIRTISKKGYLFQEETTRSKLPEEWLIRVNPRTVLIVLLALVIFVLVFIQRIEIRIDKAPDIENTTSFQST